jgi:hypothetical protein
MAYPIAALASDPAVAIAAASCCSAAATQAGTSR